MKVKRENLKTLIVEALNELGGTGYVKDIGKFIWDNYEDDIKSSDDILYTWQYDVRWAAQKLRDSSILKPVHGNRKLPWQLNNDGKRKR